MDNLKKRLKTSVYILLFLGFCFVAPFWISATLFFMVLKQGYYELLEIKPPYFLFFKLYYILTCLIMLYYLLIDKQCLYLSFLYAAIHDSCGYLGGKFLGYHSLNIKISPNKTWEGLISSFLGILITTRIIIFKIKPTCFFNYSFDWKITFLVFFFSFIITILAFFGDLLISYIKRKAHIKDSGNSLPGHGGILDRIDSSLFILWFFFLFSLIFKF